MTEGDPYRKPPATPEQYHLREMERKINKLNKYGIPLPENIREGDLLPLFKTMLEAKDEPEIKPEDIVLHSITTGILQYSGTDTITEKIQYYHYTNEETGIELVVSLNKNLNQATIISLVEKDYKHASQI